MNAKTGNQKLPNFKWHIFSLSCFAIAQPLLDIVAKNAELLVARQAGFLDLALLVFVVSMVIPAIFVLPGQVALFFSKSKSRLIFVATIGFITSLLALLVLKEFVGSASALLVLIALALGIGFAVVYARTEALPMFCDFLVPIILLVPVLFAFNSDISRVVRNFNGVEFSSPGADSNIPLVMVIFDELPLLSLLDETANIDSVRFPNFAALAAGSHWFRNAGTLSGSTTVAVPAIISGEIRPGALPLAIDYPRNLFTLLSASHEFNVSERVTSLCPVSLCKGIETQAPQVSRQQLEGFFTDLAIVYFHVLLPADLSARLPAISQSWGNFTSAGAREDEQMAGSRKSTNSALRHDQYRNFVKSITATEKPGLNFIHTLLPHVPWEYLPSGKRYFIAGSEVPGLDFATETWGDDVALVEQGYLRHLLQVGFVDKLLGELIAKLKAENLYNESLIVIVSDHGVNFWPGESRRNVFDREFALDILGITLLVKQPNQIQGFIHDREVTSLDILPSIANILQIDSDDKFQGTDLFARNDQTNYSDNPYSNYASLQRKIRLFGSGSFSNLLGRGKYSELLGLSKSDFDLQISSILTYAIDQQSSLADVSSSDALIPAQLTGEIIGSPSGYDSIDIAVMLNNKLVTVTKTYAERAIQKISVMLPEEEVKSGTNEIELFKIYSSNNGMVLLEQIRNARGSFYQYTDTGNLESISAIDNKITAITLIPGQLRGYVDSIEIGDGFLMINGWAANIQNSEPVDFMILDINGELTYLGSPDISRSDVAAAFDEPRLLKSGFRIDVRLSKFQGLESMDVKVIGISDNEASILNSNFDIGERLASLARN